MWEGLGTVLLDGLLAGCALVASDVGGVPEIVQHEVTGLLVPPKNAASLAAAILRLINNPDLSTELNAHGLSRVREHFSLDAMISGSLAAYQ